MNLFSWENAEEKYDSSLTKKNKLPIYYDFYNLSKDFKNVYEPAEDTFLLIDSILSDIQIDSIPHNLTSIELGCGNGLVSCSFLDKIKEMNILLKEHYCIDINKDATELTERLLKNYNLHENVKIIESDLFNKLDSKILFDIIIFNPPYVTTDDNEYKRALEKKDIYAAWAGGKNGSETIFRFIKELPLHISNKGILYLLLSKENKYEEIISQIYNSLHCKYEVLMKRKAVNEKLAVFKFYK